MSMKNIKFKKMWRTNLLMFVFICLLTVFTQNVCAMQSVSVKEDITIECIDGTKYQPQDFKEEFVVLFFGRTTCGNTMGMLKQAEEMLKCGASMKLVLMDIEIEDEGMQIFAQTHPDIIVAHGASGYNGLMWDLLFETGMDSGSIILPATFIMDKSRTIIYASTGFVWDDFQKTMETVCPIPHNYVKTEKAATCSQTGLRYEQCSTCGAKKPGSEEILPALGHQFGSAATCTEAQVCTRCGEVLQAALGHEWTEWNTVENATLFAPEKQEKHCIRAGCEANRTRSVGTKLPATLTLPESELSLKVSDTYEYELWGMQEGDYLDSVTSSKSWIAEVSDVKESGSFLLKGKEAGKTIVTVELASGVYDTITVTVEDKKTPNSDKDKTDVDKKSPKEDNTEKINTDGKKDTKKKAVKTTAIKKIPKRIVLRRGKTKILKPVRVPAKSKQKITFKSSNKKVATVSKKGKIIARKRGTAIITVKCGTKKVKCKVIVKK